MAAAEGGCQQPLSTSQLSPALPHQPRKLQKGWAGAKNPALLDLACKVALSCHRSCLSSPQWPPRPPSHRRESHRQAARTPTALTAQEPPGTGDSGLFLPANCPLLPRERHRRSTRSSSHPASVPKLHSPRAQQEPGSGSLRAEPGLVPGGHKRCCLVFNQTLPL